MIKVVLESVKEWGVRRRITWIGLALSYELLRRASESYESEERGVQQVYCLGMGGNALFETGL